MDRGRDDRGSHPRLTLRRLSSYPRARKQFTREEGEIYPVKFRLGWMRTEQRISFLTIRICGHAVRGRSQVQNRGCSCHSCEYKEFAVQYLRLRFFCRGEEKDVLWVFRNSCVRGKHA